MAQEESEVLELSKCEESRFQKAKLTWKIKNYEKMLDHSKAAGKRRLTSDTFIVTIPTEDGGAMNTINGSRLYFLIILYWNHKAKNKESEVKEEEENLKSKSIGMFLQFLPYYSSARTTTLTFVFSALLNDGTEWEREDPRDACEFSPANNEWGWDKVFDKEKMAKESNLLDNEGTLTIICNMEIMCNRMTLKKPLYQPFSLTDELRMDTESKDVTLVCQYDENPQDKEKTNGHSNSYSVHCHKFILTTRSDVFKAMFSHGRTSESQTNTIIIEDTPFDVLQEFVDYLYTDKSESLVSDSVEDIGAMLRLADKYNVQSLKQHCENRLLQMIKSSTVGEIYALAYMCNCDPLGKAVTSYIANNFEEAFKLGCMVDFTQGMQDRLMKDIWALKVKAAK